MAVRGNRVELTEGDRVNKVSASLAHGNQSLQSEDEDEEGRVIVDRIY